MLLADCLTLTPLQRAAGFVTWMNVLRVAAIVGFIGCVGVLLMTWFRWLIAAFFLIPVQLYEVIGYAIAFGLLVFAHRYSPDDQLWFLLSGSLLFAAMMVFSANVHNVEANYTRFFGTLFAVWTAVALYYSNSVIGFMAVAAFMGMMGFSFAAIPMGYAIGFSEEDAVPRATIAAGLTMILAIAWRLAVKSVPNPLESGALWLGTFVFYLGLLIIASRYYRTRVSYLLRQIAPVAFGMLAIEFGNTLHISQLAGIGGTFFVLYLVEKAADIPARSLTQYATVGLFVFGALGALVWWGQHHLDLVRPYLLF